MTQGFRTSSWRWLLVALLLAVQAVALAAPARGHSDLESTAPQQGSTVVGPVEEIELTFVNPIVFDQSTFEVLDDSGAPYSVSAITIANDDRTVMIALDPAVIEGVVGVGYTIISADTHPRVGSFTFAVQAPPLTPTPEPTPTPTVTPVREPTPTGSPAPVASDNEPAPVASPTAEPTATPSPTPAATPTPAPTAAVAGTVVDDAPPPPRLSNLFADPTTVDRLVDAQTILRGLGYAAGMALIGGLIYFASVAGESPTGMRRWILILAAIGTIVSGLGLLATQAALAAGGETSALASPADWAEVFEGSFAVGIALRVVAGVAALGAVSMGPAAWVVAGAATMSFPFLGHGAARDPTWLVFPADVVHVLAVGVWTGGLLMLVLGLVLDRPPASLSSASANRVQVIGRYSSIAGFALAAALFTGTALAATELDSLSDLVDTSYGKRLVVKLALVSGVIGLGAFQRYRVIPRIRAEGANSPAVRRIVRAGFVEIMVMGLVILVTTLLVSAAA